MAMLQEDSSYSNSSHPAARKTSHESSRGANTQASVYAVNAATMALTGYHFSTLRAGGLEWWV